MANCKQSTKTVSKVVTEAVEVRTFALELTEKEAEFLFGVTGDISTEGANIESSLNHRVYAALRDAGVHRRDLKWGDRPHIVGSVMEIDDE